MKCGADFDDVKAHRRNSPEINLAWTDRDQPKFIKKQSKPNQIKPKSRNPSERLPNFKYIENSSGILLWYVIFEIQTHGSLLIIPVPTTNIHRLLYSHTIDACSALRLPHLFSILYVCHTNSIVTINHQQILHL